MPTNDLLNGQSKIITYLGETIAPASSVFNGNNSGTSLLTIDDSGSVRSYADNRPAFTNTLALVEKGKGYIVSAKKDFSFDSATILGFGNVPVGSSDEDMKPKTILTKAFNRPANTTAYIGSASNPVVVADSTLTSTQDYLKFANAIDTAGGFTQLLRADLKKASPSLTNASFRLWLYNVQPTVGNDSGVFALASSGLLGYVDFVNFVSGGSGSNAAISMVSDLNLTLQGANASRDVYAVLTATSAYTPTSAENISVTLYFS